MLCNNTSLTIEPEFSRNLEGRKLVSIMEIIKPGFLMCHTVVCGILSSL